MKVSLDPHPAALLFPAMGEGELAELAEDIRAHGLLEPIVIHDELILDGRNRLVACQIAGVEPRYEKWAANGVTPFEYVIAKNLHRRHLTVGQRAALALALLPHLEAEAKERQGVRHDLRPETDESGGRSDEKAAHLVGVGRTTVARAKAVQKRDPEVIEQLRSGEINISDAERATGFSPGPTPIDQIGRRDSSGRVQPEIRFGKGDKWHESTEPLKRYLSAWRKKGFEFRHINPREARKRVEIIDRLISDLQGARADIEPRSYKAKLTI